MSRRAPPGTLAIATLGLLLGGAAPARAADVSATYTATVSGNQLRLDGKVCNDGMAPATFRASFWLVRDAAPGCGATDADASAVLTLAAGACESFSDMVDLTGAPAGTYRTHLFADSDCTLAETDETDNLVTRSFSYGKANLYVKAFSATVSGGALTYAGTLCNAGATAVRPFTIRLWRDSLETPTCASTGADLSGDADLAAGACASFSVSEAVSGTATRQARLLLDATCVVPEPDELDNDAFSVYQVGKSAAFLASRLSGGQEVPAVSTAGFGSASVTVRGDRSAIDVTVNTAGVSGKRAAHIHLGDRGKNGPVIFTLAAASFPDTHSVVLTPAMLVKQPAMGVNTFADALTRILSGRTYINVHTTAHPGGEIRGAVLPASTRRYRVTFVSTWSMATHPFMFPPGPHFSGLIGGTHNARASVWKPGATASRGIENMAETGSKSPLDAEVRRLIDRGDAERVLSGPFTPVSPGMVTMTFTASQPWPLVSLVAMIAPSPDWFAGVHDLPLIENGRWVASRTVTLYAYDAGTDSGASYLSADKDTMPREPIRRVTTPHFKVAGKLVPVGTMTFTAL